MYQKKDSYRNYYSHSKMTSSNHIKTNMMQSPRQNSYKGALNHFIYKKKSKSDININFTNNTQVSKLNNFNLSNLKNKNFNSLYDNKPQKYQEKQLSLGKNLQKYKIKKIEQKLKESITNEKAQYQFPQSPSSRYMRSSSSSKKVLSARKPSDMTKITSEMSRVPSQMNKVHVDMKKSGGQQTKKVQQNKKRQNLEIDTANFNQFFQNKRLQTHMPQTTKSIMQYNKVIKKNQMALRPYQESKLIFKKHKQCPSTVEIRQSNQTQQQTINQTEKYGKFKKINATQRSHNLSPKTTRRIQTNFNDTVSTIQFNKKHSESPLSINDFLKFRQLGKGQNGKIYAAIHKKTGLIVALKHFQQTKIILDYLIDQMKIQLFSKHKNILAAYGYIIEKSYTLDTTGVYLTQKQQNRSYYNIYIIMQKGQCNLFSLIKRQKQLSQEDTAIYTQQILHGLKYLHQNKIIHRDLKPQNIILVNGVCKITDFGWSVIGSQQRQTFCGTLQYVSPEVAIGTRYDNKIDIWSVGVLIFQMITGEAPYDTSKILQNPKDQYRKRILSRLPLNTSFQCKQLLSKLLKIDPKRRITIDQALNHRWIKQATVRKTLRKDVITVKQQFQKILHRY